jgi:hypothetical protein
MMPRYASAASCSAARDGLVRTALHVKQASRNPAGATIASMISGMVEMLVSGIIPTA